MGTLGHSNVLSIRESLYTSNQKTGKFGAEDVFSECSGKQQAGQDSGVFYENGTRIAGSFGMEGVVWYVVLPWLHVNLCCCDIALYVTYALCHIAAFPFVKNPEDNPTYSVYFSKQWHDTMLVSLHNFLATIFQVGKKISRVAL